MTRAQVLEDAQALHAAALAAEDRAAAATSLDVQQRALNEAQRLHERARSTRALAPRAALREIGCAP